MNVKKTRRSKKSFSQQMQELAQEYMDIHNLESFDLEEVSIWACSTGRYQRRPMTMVQQCKRELSDALRIQKYTDLQGREVRKMHPVRLKQQGAQMVIWADIEKAKPQHMRVSLAQSRQGILADCIAHNTIAESYNDNNHYDATIELFDYNFNPDIAEKKLPTDYPDEAPGEDI
jgi:tRNA U54 and U55 pseudouridine synthase Pus10